MITLSSSRAIAKPAEGWICRSCRQNQTWLGHVDSGSIIDQGVAARSFRLRKQGPLRRYASAASNSAQNTPRRDEKLPSSPARTRFAPSPTGYMHIGGLRTALFSYLLARRTNGQFLLRIEDTDQKRLVRDAEDRLCEDLLWAGLQWDEGPQVNGPFGPYRQSERSQLYQQHAHELLNNGSAYRCFCTPQTAGSMGGGKAAFVTSGCYQDCSSLPSDQAQERAESKAELFTVRLKQPMDVHKRVYKDLIYGKIQRLKRSPSASQGDEDDSGLDAADTILVKSDGTPTYHFANVVDDHLMKITHVIRGSEWMASTPLHYDLYTAFGWEPPAFAHVGLLVDENKAKLSKRSNTGLVLDVKGMREQEGILPEVLCNFLALLGWSNPGRNDVLEMEELIRDFDLKFTRGNTVVKMEKLWFLQKQHVARKCERSSKESSLQPIASLVQQISNEVRTAYPDAAGRSSLNDTSLDSFCANLLLADSKSYQTPRDYVRRNRYFFSFSQSEVPPQADFYDQEHRISGEALSSFLRQLLYDFDWARSYQDNPFVIRKSSSSETVGPSPSAIDITSARIHAAINLRIWEIIRGSTLSNSAHGHDIQSEDLPFTSEPIDIEACARQILKQSAVPEVDLELAAKEAVKQYKDWNKAVMRFLREKLSYGLPGPGVGAIMALLGYEECCRRLGAEPQKSGGW